MASVYAGSRLRPARPNATPRGVTHSSGLKGGDIGKLLIGEGRRFRHSTGIGRQRVCCRKTRLSATMEAYQRKLTKATTSPATTSPAFELSLRCRFSISPMLPVPSSPRLLVSVLPVVRLPVSRVHIRSPAPAFEPRDSGTSRFPGELPSTGMRVLQFLGYSSWVEMPLRGDGSVFPMKRDVTPGSRMVRGQSAAEYGLRGAASEE